MELQEIQSQINLGLGVACGFLSILVIYLLCALSNLKKRIASFLPKNKDFNIEEMLVEYINKVNFVLETEDTIHQKIDYNNTTTLEIIDCNYKELVDTLENNNSTTNNKIDSINQDTNNKIDSINQEINNKIDSINQDTNNKIDSINQEINNKIDSINQSTTQALENANHRIDLTNIKMLNSVQKYSLVRYNPFDDVGGDFCYSIAFLDGANSGFVLTSIYSREGGYSYAKEINDGISTQKLSPEEEQCLNQAMSIQVQTV